MEKTIFDWLLNLPSMFAQFGDWLITPLPYINMAPLGLISVAGISAIIGFLALRLIIGG